MVISYLGGEKFKAEYRSHSILIDQPKDAGGDDLAMTPPELLIASLGSCIGVYAVNFLKNTGIDSAGLTINLTWEKASEPARVSKIRAEVIIPNARLDKREPAFLKVVEHCLVHNTLTNKVEIEIKVK